MRTRSQVAAAVVVALALIVLGCAPEAPGRTAPIDAKVAGIERIGKRKLDVTLASPAVGRDVLVRLLLPRRFDQQPRRRWPVLYLLHGCCDTYKSWTRSTDIERLSRPHDVLVVMPDGGPVGFYSDWLRGPAWERFHMTELRRALERRFHAGERRAIAGLSMGGLGAMSYAARNPGLFRAAASYSGLLHTRLTPGDSAAVLGLVQSQGERPLDLWGDPAEDAERWAAHNPYDLARRLRGVSLFVSSGNGQPGPLDPADPPPDEIEPNVLRQTTAFVDRIHRLAIPARVDLYGNGTHSWPYWERELHRSWPMLMHAIGG